MKPINMMGACLLQFENRCFIANFIENKSMAKAITGADIRTAGLVETSLWNFLDCSAWFSLLCVNRKEILLKATLDNTREVTALDREITALGYKEIPLVDKVKR